MKKNTIIAGAGVSLDAPSNFPIVTEIIDKVLMDISPNENIYRQLKKTNIRDNGDNGLSGDFIRFEALIEIVMMYDRDLSILDAIKEYKDPNQNHFNLAMAAINGNYVITTNFDDLIERAVLSMDYKPYTVFSIDDWILYLKHKESDVKLVPIFKIHGSYYQYRGGIETRTTVKNTLQATLCSIVEGNNILKLPEIKQNLLKYFISNSSTLLFVGYSGSDDFDIMPSLNLIEPPHTTWIYHSNGINSDKGASKFLTVDVTERKLLDIQVKQEKNIRGDELYLLNMHNLGNHISCYTCNTSEYLKGMYGYSLNTKKNKDDNPFLTHIGNWSKKLQFDDKIYIIEQLFHRLSMCKEAIEILNIIDIPNDIIRHKFQLVKNLQNLNSYKEAYEILGEIWEVDSFNAHQEFPNLLERKAYLLSKLFEREQGVYGKEEIIHLFNKAINLLIEEGMPVRTAYINYGLFLFYIKENEKALFYFDKALYEANEKGDFINILNLYNNKSIVLFDKGEFVEAEKVAAEGLELADKLGVYRLVSCFENLLSNLYLISGKIDLAIKSCKRGLCVDADLGDKSDLAISFLLLGQCYFEKKEYRYCEAYYDESLFYFHGIDVDDYLYELRFFRILLFVSLRRFNEAQGEFDQMRPNSENRVEELFYLIASVVLNTDVSSVYTIYLQQLYDMGEVVSYINIIYYLCLLDFPCLLIGKPHVVNAIAIYNELGNDNRVLVLSKSIN